jgi:putative copper export protein
MILLCRSYKDFATTEHCSGAAPFDATPYGRYVFLKAVCFLILIGLGAVNRFKLIPGLRGTPSEVPLLAENWQKLHKNIFIEQALLIVILFAVARLGLLAPPDLK